MSMLIIIGSGGAGATLIVAFSARDFPIVEPSVNRGIDATELVIDEAKQYFIERAAIEVLDEYFELYEYDKVVYWVQAFGKTRPKATSFQAYKGRRWEPP